MRTTILEKCKLVEEAGQFYLELVYVIEDEAEVRRVTIPRARLPVNRGVCPEISTECVGITDLFPTVHVKAGYDSALLDLERRENKYYIVEILKEKTRKLTVSEIERKLGYKIEIISEDSKR